MAFIVFEGGDGAGKSTQCRSLLHRLRRRGYPVVITREPGGTPIGESLRRLLKSQQNISNLSELLLFEAARAQLVEQVIRRPTHPRRGAVERRLEAKRRRGARKAERRGDWV